MSGKTSLNVYNGGARQMLDRREKLLFARTHTHRNSHTYAQAGDKRETKSSCLLTGDLRGAMGERESEGPFYFFFK